MDESWSRGVRCDFVDGAKVCDLASYYIVIRLRYAYKADRTSAFVFPERRRMLKE